MSRLKVPSLQHLARFLKSDARQVRLELLRIVAASPPFSYAPLVELVRDALLPGGDFFQAMTAVERKVKLPVARKNYLEILPLLSDHFRGVRPLFVHNVTRRYFPVSRTLSVPFDPPLVYGTERGLVLPIFSFWRSYCLSGEELSFFVTLVRKLLAQDPDLESAELVMLDMQAVDENRTLSVEPLGSIELLSDRRLRELLTALAEGFRLAEADLAAMPRPNKGDEDRDPRQISMFKPS